MPGRQRAQDRTFGFAAIPVIQMVLMTSRKRTLPATIGHPHEARLLDGGAQHAVRTPMGITSAAEWFPPHAPLRVQEES